MEPDVERPRLTWRALREQLPNQVLGGHLYGLPEHGICYVKNPKAACSTVLLWMDRLHTGEHDFSPDSVHTDNRLPTIDQIGRRNLLRMLEGGSYRFAFVRDPLRRLQSAYVDKLVDSRRFRYLIQRTLGQPRDKDRPVSLDDFVTALERQDPVTEMDPHWRPQYVNLLMPLLTFDHIGRVETFAEDLETIRKAAGLPHVPVEVRNVKTTGRPSIFADRPDLEERVRVIYAKDYELFGY